jgi:hypothetical protein
VPVCAHINRAARKNRRMPWHKRDITHQGLLVADEGSSLDSS